MQEICRIGQNFLHISFICMKCCPILYQSHVGNTRKCHVLISRTGRKFHFQSSENIQFTCSLNISDIYRAIIIIKQSSAPSPCIFWKCFNQTCRYKFKYHTLCDIYLEHYGTCTWPRSSIDLIAIACTSYLSHSRFVTGIE